MSLIDRLTPGAEHRAESDFGSETSGRDPESHPVWHRCCTPSLCTDVDWGFDLEMGQWPPWAQQVREILLLSPKAADQLSLLMQGDMSSIRRDKLGI